MDKEYDFSKAERGKFYRPGTKLNIPIYLDDEAFAFVDEIARKKNTDATCVVNQFLHTDKLLLDMTKSENKLIHQILVPRIGDHGVGSEKADKFTNGQT